MTNQHARLSSVQIETIAGFSAGTFSTLIFHPLDIVKTRLQIYRSTLSYPITAVNILKGLVTNNNPVQSLYRGLAPNLVGNAGSWSLFLGFKSVIEHQILKSHSSVSQNHSSQNLSGNSRSRALLTSFDFFLASAISGMMVTLFTNPIWILKTRMVSSDRSSYGAYRSMWHGVKMIVKEEGFRGFYKGVGIGLLGNSHGAVQFGVYEPIKNLWRKYEGHFDNFGDKIEQKKKLGIIATLSTSGSAKIIAGTVTYPIQVIKSRLQASRFDHISGGGISGVSRRIWKEHGWKGFYKGLSINVIRVLPVTWVTFLVYENIRYHLEIIDLSY